MEVLIIKLGASGDVVRTTPLLRRLGTNASWLTSSKNTPLLEGLEGGIPKQVLPWELRDALLGQSFDLVVNLEDDLETARFAASVRSKRLFGAYATDDGDVHYTRDAQAWFDLSLISARGRREADRLKLENRCSYQELIFGGLGLQFDGEEYLLPATQKGSLEGDVAVAPEAGPVWPMKNWAYYEWLVQEVRTRGWTVNVLPLRPTLLEHLADIRQHRCVVSGDSLPMHLAIGSHVPCVALFTCTSPWEIHDYPHLTKLVSSELSRHFYSREFDPHATTAIPKEHVLDAVLNALNQ